MCYRCLGFAVWRGAKWYVRHRAGSALPSKRVTAAGLVSLAVVGLVVQGARRESGTSS